MSTVPLMDLGWQAKQIKGEVLSKWSEMIDSAQFILGKPVADFEQEFAEYSGIAGCVGVANGTDALEIAVRALDIGVGDEVIVPANSFIASAIGVSRAGAIPVFVDCLPGTYLIDPDAVRKAITPRTKAIMPVHLYGQMASMAPLVEISTEYGIPIIEDAAQAQGAKQDGRMAGSFGVLSGTSFYPGKNLGAFGDAGAVLSTSEEYTARARAIRNYGSEQKYQHPEFGFNSRLDSLQAVVLLAKLRHLDEWTEQREQIAARYSTELAGIEGFELPAVAEGNTHVWHLYVVHLTKRDQLLARLRERGIDAGIHYPLPIHLQGAYQSLGYVEGDFPVAEKSGRECLSLPIYPGMTEQQQSTVINELRAVLNSLSIG